MSATAEKFSAEYYATRNYRDYMTRKFDALADELIRLTPIFKGSSVLDFGCGYGGLVNALHSSDLDLRVCGTDISQWAIEEGHKRFPKLSQGLQFYNRDLLRQKNDVVIMLDVLEHMPEYEIESCLKLARRGCSQIAVRIPVCAVEGEPFVLPVSNNDPTHITCHAYLWWMELFASYGFDSSFPYSGSTIYDSPGVLARVYA